MVTQSPWSGKEVVIQCPWSGKEVVTQCPLYYPLVGAQYVELMQLHHLIIL